MKTLTNKNIIRLFDHKSIKMECFTGYDENDVYHVIVNNHNDYNKLDKLYELLRHSDRVTDNLQDLIFIGWEDEYATCDDCGKIIKLTPSYYGDIKKYWISDYGILCEACTIENSDVYIDCLDNNPQTANVILSDEQLKKHGYIRYNIECYESGFHIGQNDNPRDIYKKLRNKYDHIIFDIDHAGQFDVMFNVYVKENN